MVSAFAAAVRKRPPPPSTHETWKPLMDFGLAAGVLGERQLHSRAAKHINSADAVAFAGICEFWVVGMVEGAAGLVPPS